MFKGSFRIKSEEEIKKEKEERKVELKKLVYNEYNEFKKFINFYELPDIKDIVFLNMKNCEASVSPVLHWPIELRINETYLKKNTSLEYLKIILFHEFTHIWDRTVKYGSIKTPELTEYHAVQIALAKNLNQKFADRWENFSETQLVWYGNKRITVQEYLQNWLDHFSYDMEYHYYNESDNRTHQFMYDLCQWIGYGVIFEKYCIEWSGKRKVDGFIPQNMKDLIEQFYIGLRDCHEQTEIDVIYAQICFKFSSLNRIQVTNNENYFLEKDEKSIRLEDSLIKHCAAIENVCKDMKEKHTPGFLINRPYLDKRFVYQYFKKAYQDMLSKTGLLFIFKDYLEHYILRCPDTIDEMNKILDQEIRPLFETESYFKIIIKKIALLESVVEGVDENRKRTFKIMNIQDFIKEIGFTTAFLAALLVGIEDAGYEITFADGLLITELFKH